MQDSPMEPLNTNANAKGDNNADLDFCISDDFSSVSHSTALISPSGAEFDLIVKVSTYFGDCTKEYYKRSIKL